MTHYHDVTLTEIDSICSNKLFTHDDQSLFSKSAFWRIHSVSEYARQQLRQCIIHKNFRKSTYDFTTGSCSSNIEHDKLLHTKQRNNCNNLIRISDEEWEQSCTYTSIHTMFAFLCMIMHTEETLFSQPAVGRIRDASEYKCTLAHMELCIVCEKEAKDAIFAMLNQLEIYFAEITYINQEELEKDSLYLHRFVSEYDNNDGLHLHLLILSPIDKNMVPNISKENTTMSYTFLTGIVSAADSPSVRESGEVIFPPVTFSPCFTGVIATIVIRTTLVCNTKNMRAQVSKYGDDECICGTNMEYEEDVIHSHYRSDREKYDKDNTYSAPYFHVIGKPMPRSKFLNDAIEDCLGCRVVARIIIDKRQKPKRSHCPSEDEVINKLSKIR